MVKLNIFIFISLIITIEISSKYNFQKDTIFNNIIFNNEYKLCQNKINIFKEKISKNYLIDKGYNFIVHNYKLIIFLLIIYYTYKKYEEYLEDIDILQKIKDIIKFIKNKGLLIKNKTNQKMSQFNKLLKNNINKIKEKVKDKFKEIKIFNNVIKEIDKKEDNKIIDNKLKNDINLIKSNLNENLLDDQKLLSNQFNQVDQYTKELKEDIKEKIIKTENNIELDINKIINNSINKEKYNQNNLDNNNIESNSENNHQKAKYISNIKDKLKLIKIKFLTKKFIKNKNNKITKKVYLNKVLN